MAKFVIVGYRCAARKAAVSILESLPAPDFEAMCPKSFTGQRRADRIAADKTEWEAGIANRPYSGALSEVYLAVVDDGCHEPRSFLPQPEMSVTAQVAEYLLATFPDAWPVDFTKRKTPPEVIFVGFNTRHFLKMFGLNAALPAYGSRLPASLWFGSGDHRDLEEALIPKDYRPGVTWPLVVACHRQGIRKKSHLLGYDRAVKDWYGPGSTTARQDAEVAFVLGVGAGIVIEKKKKISDGVFGVE